MLYCMLVTKTHLLKLGASLGLLFRGQPVAGSLGVGGLPCCGMMQKNAASNEAAMQPAELAACSAAQKAVLLSRAFQGMAQWLQPVAKCMLLVWAGLEKA